MIDDIIKWLATGVLIVGTAFNGLGMYPEGPLISILGGTLWLVVSIRWREPALIITNAVMLLTVISTLVYHYWLTIGNTFAILFTH